MDYSRVTPRARNGTSGISTEEDIGRNELAWLSPPDRIAAISVSVHIPENASAEFAVECTCNRPEVIGADGTGGYWDAVEEEHPTYSESVNLNLCNTVTGIRVRCISARWNGGIDGEEEPKINVCFCG